MKKTPSASTTPAKPKSRTSKKATARPHIESAEGFVDALGNAVEQGWLPGVFGLDDHGSALLAPHAFAITLEMTNGRRILLSVSDLPTDEEPE